MQNNEFTPKPGDDQNSAAKPPIPKPGPAPAKPAPTPGPAPANSANSASPAPNPAASPTPANPTPAAPPATQPGDQQAAADYQAQLDPYGYPGYGEPPQMPSPSELAARMADIAARAAARAQLESDMTQVAAMIGPSMEPRQIEEIPEGARVTYLLVDGENIDATLGNSLLGRRPQPDERPRWERVHDFVRELWGQPVKPLFFLNSSSGHMPLPFIQALLALGYRPIPLSGSVTEKVVDLGIQKMLEAIAEKGGDVVLASHDGDFLPQITKLQDDERRVALVGFMECFNLGFATLEGVERYDLETQVGAFQTPLPRVKVIPIDAFDPFKFL